MPIPVIYPISSPCRCHLRRDPAAASQPSIRASVKTFAAMSPIQWTDRAWSSAEMAGSIARSAYQATSSDWKARHMANDDASWSRCRAPSLRVGGQERWHARGVGDELREDGGQLLLGGGRAGVLPVHHDRSPADVGQDVLRIEVQVAGDPWLMASGDDDRLAGDELRDEACEGRRPGSTGPLGGREDALAIGRPRPGR